MVATKPLLIRGGRVVDPSQSIDQVGDVLIEDGKVASVESSISLGSDFQGDILDAKGLLVTPGWIDIHTHLRQPGFSHRETIATGSLAAAAGGFTSIACMANTNPVNDNSFVTSYLYQKISTEAVNNIYVVGALSKGLKGEELAAIGSMWEVGIVGISDDGLTVMNSYLVRKAMDYSRRFDLVVMSHAEDSFLKGEGVMNEGFHSSKFGLRGIPHTSEDAIVARDILLSELTGAKLHVMHVSTKGAVELIRQAKQRGVKVTAEVAPHHLVLTDEVVGNYDTNTKVSPPLREPEDLEALANAVADGTIDALASDHAPHTEEEKEVEYDQAEFGMVGLETAFPLYYRGVLSKKYSLKRMIEAMTVRPAQIIDIPKGTLQKDVDGDITVSDLSQTWEVDKAEFFSKSQNTPFHGYKVQGKVCHTIVKGKIVYQSDHLGDQQ